MGESGFRKGSRSGQGQQAWGRGRANSLDVTATLSVAEQGQRAPCKRRNQRRVGRAGCDEHPRKLFWPRMGCRGRRGGGEGRRRAAGPIATHLHRVQGVAHSNTADTWKEARARGEHSGGRPRPRPVSHQQESHPVLQTRQQRLRELKGLPTGCWRWLLP